MKQIAMEELPSGNESFLEQLQPIQGIEDLGDKVEITTSHFRYRILKSRLKIEITSELQNYCFQNSGADTIWGPTWEQTLAWMKEKNVILPEAVSPCNGCDSTKCQMWCHRKLH